MAISKITLATLNTLGNPFQVDNLVLRYAAIASFFEKSDVDVLHFQEVFSFPHLFILRRKLKSYRYCIYKKSYLGPKGGLVTFSRVPIEVKKYKSFSKKRIAPIKKSVLEFLFTKGMLIAKVRNSNLYLMNAHLSAVYTGDWSDNTMFKGRLSSEISEFNQELSLLSVDQNVTLISGDFNTAKASNFYDQLKKSPLLYDSFEKSSKPTYHPEYLPKGRTNNCIDYIFIYGNKKNYFVLDRERILEEKLPLSTTLKNYATDHIGLKVTVELINDHN